MFMIKLVNSGEFWTLDTSNQANLRKSCSQLPGSNAAFEKILERACLAKKRPEETWAFRKQPKTSFMWRFWWWTMNPVLGIQQFLTFFWFSLRHFWRTWPKKCSRCCSVLAQVEQLRADGNKQGEAQSSIFPYKYDDFGMISVDFLHFLGDGTANPRNGSWNMVAKNIMNHGSNFDKRFSFATWDFMWSIFGHPFLSHTIWIADIFKSRWWKNMSAISKTGDQLWKKEKHIKAPFWFILRYVENVLYHLVTMDIGNHHIMEHNLRSFQSTRC